MLKAGQIVLQRRKVVGRCSEHEIGHPRIIAARPGAEIGDCFGQVFATLPRQSWYGATALTMIEMAAGAADRVLSAESALRNILWRPRLAYVGPPCVREILRKCTHVFGPAEPSD